jgi:rod shape determining protein RodA
MMDELKKARFLCLIFVEKYTDNVGWQQNLALIAIGSGKLWGVGYLKGGNQYLYARNTDFIFTVAAGEFGFMGGLALFAILILILLALYRSILAARDLQGMLLCGGLMALIGFQSLINLGMNLRLLPVIGITLPFFSRGGSSLATLFIGVGVALSVYYSGKTRSHDTIFTNNRY